MSSPKERAESLKLQSWNRGRFRGASWISALLGCKKVLFIGQDMAVRDDGRYYTDDSFYSDSGDHYTSNTSGHRLPGNTQDEVLVEGRLFVYLKTFEQFIVNYPQVEYRNLARTGVRIKGAPYQTYEDALQWIGPGTSSKPFVDKVLPSG